MFQGLHPLEKFGRFAETEEEQQDPQPIPQELPEEIESKAIPPPPTRPAAPAYKPQLIILDLSDDEDEPARPVLPVAVYEAQDVELDSFIEIEDDSQDEVEPESSLKPPQTDSVPIIETASSNHTDSALNQVPAEKEKPQTHQHLLKTHQTQNLLPKTHQTLNSLSKMNSLHHQFRRVG